MNKEEYIKNIDALLTSCNDEKVLDLVMRLLMKTV